MKKSLLDSRLPALICLLLLSMQITGCSVTSAPNPSAAAPMSASLPAQSPTSPTLGATQAPSGGEQALLQARATLPIEQIESVPSAIALLEGLETIPDSLIGALIELAENAANAVGDVPDGSDAKQYLQNDMQLVELEMGHFTVKPDYTRIGEALSGRISPPFEAFFALHQALQERDIEHLYTGSGYRVTQEEFFDNLSQRYAFVQTYRDSAAFPYGVLGLDMDVRIFWGISELGNHGIYDPANQRLMDEVKAGYQYAAREGKGALADLTAEVYAIWERNDWTINDDVANALDTVDLASLGLNP